MGGTEIQIAAEPAPGYTLGHWRGGLSGRANPATLVVSGDAVVTASFVERANVFEEGFETYTTGADPDGWYDTAAQNSMAQNDSLFQVYETGDGQALGTVSTLSNIHSHYMDEGSETWSGYRYSGRMMMTAAAGGVGVTFYSRYADQDVYYRLRRHDSTSFHLAPHPHNAVKLEGDLETGVTPRPEMWHWFLIEVEDTGTRTEIRAKVWPQGTDEPEAWQIQARHSGSGRLAEGRIGLWSHSLGSKYWDDIVVEPIGWPSDDY